MSCFGATPATPAYYSSSYYASSSGRPWRARCAAIAAAVGARLRRSLSLKKRMGGRGTHARHRRHHHAPVVSSSAVHHHRSFAPVYVDDLYCAQHQQHPAADAVHVVVQQLPTTTSGAKLAAPVHAPAAHASPPVVLATGAATGKSAAAAATTRPPKKPSRNVALLRSPGRGVLCGAVVKGMGEVDLRAELFISKFKEDMRLQSQRSAEELQAMLARGL